MNKIAQFQKTKTYIHNLSEIQLTWAFLARLHFSAEELLLYPRRRCRRPCQRRRPRRRRRSHAKC